MRKWKLRKVSNRGTSDPIVARLGMQISELIPWSSIPKEHRDKVLECCIWDLKSRLGRCKDISEKLSKEQQTCIESRVPDEDGFIEIPHIQDLDRDVDDFLYQAKNFLREFVNVVMKAFYPDIKFRDATALWDGKVIEWATAKFGADDQLTKMLRDDQPWIEELVRKRNAVEHPGGHSGKLIVQNFEMVDDLNVILPVWKRTLGQATTISQDMEAYCHNLLTFTEELILALIQKTCFAKGIGFAEIPEAERDPQAPMRFRAVFTEPR